MKPLFLLLFILIGLNYLSFSQTDELKETNHYTTSEINFMRNNLDSLKIDAMEILLIGLDNKNNYAINVGKRSLGSYLIRSGQQKEGLNYLKMANSYFQEKGDYEIQTETLNEIGNGFLLDGKPLQAEKYFLLSLEAGKNSPDPTSSFLAEANLAQAYINLGNYERAEGYLQHYKKEALKYEKFESVANAYALLGSIALIRNKKALAKEYFDKSAKFGFQSKSKALIAHAYNNKAIVYFDEGERDSSLAYFNKALELRLLTNNAKSISESYFNLGDFYLEIKDFAKSLNYYKQCEHYCKQKKLLREELDVTEALTKLYKTQGNYEQAFSYSEKRVKLLETYYHELAKEQTSNKDLIFLLGEMENESQAEIRQAKLKSDLSDQKYQSYLLFIALAIFVVGIILLMLYKNKIQ
jgi:tetratricopeptide (TPR) repeat protein